MKVHLANSNAWSDSNEYIMGTASEVHTNALFDIYPNDTTITAEFKGNTQQNGTPSPSAPVPVVGVGYLDGTAYKIPIEIGLSTQSIDLSAVQTTRKINKIIFDANANVSFNAKNDITSRYLVTVPVIGGTNTPSNVLSTHYKTQDIVDKVFTEGGISMRNTGIAVVIGGTYADIGITAPTDGATIVSAVKSYFADQYAASTPITIWYVLSDPVTDTINEPLQKIGDYADSISNISLTTTAGAKSFGVDTAVKPSEITLNFRGWHPKDPKESTGGEWS